MNSPDCKWLGIISLFRFRWHPSVFCYFLKKIDLSLFISLLWFCLDHFLLYLSDIISSWDCIWLPYVVDSWCVHSGKFDLYVQAYSPIVSSTMSRIDYLSTHPLQIYLCLNIIFPSPWDDGPFNFCIVLFVDLHSWSNYHDWLLGSLDSPTWCHNLL